MTPTIEQSAPKEALVKAVPSVGPPERVIARPFAKADHDRPKRTVGERLLDILVYPIINNFGVFAISVGATYLTSKGSEVGKDGSTLRAVGNWFQRRGDWMTNAFQKTGMNADSAKMAKTVFFSFFDGTLVAPLVKLLEDRREKMARGIDRTLGTTPADDSVYTVEPKQTWGSVISGRLATSLIVVPTAVALDKFTHHGEPLNNFLFKNPGLKKGLEIKSNPKLAKYFGKLDIPELVSTTYFEAFYTTVCTGGLYFISRFIAKQNKEHKQAVADYKEQHKQAVVAALKTEDVTAQAPQEPTAKPQPQINNSAYEARLQPVRTQEVTA